MNNVPKLPHDFIAFDLEYNQPSHRIIQIGVAYTEDRIPEAKSFSILVNPREDIDSYITNLTGITNQDILEKGISYQAAIRELQSFLETRSFYTQPITWGSSDLRLLKAQAESYGIPQEDTPWLRSTALNLQNVISFQELCKGVKAKNYSLRSACTLHKVPQAVPAHDARVDAINTLNLFLEVHRKSRILYDFLNQAKGL